MYTGYKVQKNDTSYTPVADNVHKHARTTTYKWLCFTLFIWDVYTDKSKNMRNTWNNSTKIGCSWQHDVVSNIIDYLQLCSFSCNCASATKIILKTFNMTINLQNIIKKFILVCIRFIQALFCHVHNVHTIVDYRSNFFQNSINATHFMQLFCHGNLQYKKRSVANLPKHAK